MVTCRLATCFVLIALTLLLASCSLRATDAGIWTVYTAQDGLETQYINTLGFASNGTLWIGGWSISSFDGQNWINFDSSLARGHHIWSFAEGPDGDLWFGTFNDGAYRFDGEIWTHYPPNDSEGLTADGVGSMAVAPDGTMWFGGFCGFSVQIGCGAFHFDGENWTRYMVDYEPYGGLSGNFVNSIVVGPDGTLWFGGPIGVAHFHGETWTMYTEEDGLVDSNVRSIAVAPDGSLWFGTLGGVSHFDGREWTNYTSEDGLVYNKVKELTVAPDGTVWVATAEGVSSFDGERWRTYTTRDGLGSNEISAIAAAQDGTIWFGSDHSLSRYSPPDFTTGHFLPGGALQSERVRSYAVERVY